MKDIAKDKNSSFLEDSKPESLKYVYTSIFTISMMAIHIRRGINLPIFFPFLNQKYFKYFLFGSFSIFYIQNECLLRMVNMRIFLKNNYYNIHDADIKDNF